MMDKIDGLIKDYFERRKTGVSGRREDGLYPSAEILTAYLSDELTGEALERLLGWLRNNPDGQALVSQARELLNSPGGWENEEVPEKSIQVAKSLMSTKSPGVACPHCGKPITPFKKGTPPQGWKNVLWLVLGAVFFGLSFAVPRYFYQCLAAALFFGFKWVIERRAAKTQILIYKALSDGSASEHQRLHQHSSRL